MGQHFRMSLASLILDPYDRLASDQYLSRHGERFLAKLVRLTTLLGAFRRAFDCKN